MEEFSSNPTRSYTYLKILIAKLLRKKQAWGGKENKFHVTYVAEAQQYVREQVAEYGYPLEVYKTDVSYDKLACQYGFPGASAHGKMFGLLKRRPLRAAISDHTYSEKKRVAVWLEILHLYCDVVGLRAKDQLLRDYDLKEKEVLALYMNVISHFPGTFAQQLFLLECLKQEEAFFRQEPKKVLLVTGARERESRRRMSIIKPLSEEGPMTWLAPFFDWDASDVMDYMECSGIRPSPVYPFLHYSGECTCGSFAVKGQLGDLLIWFPERGNHILELQDQAWKAGFHWGWEDQPPPDYLLHRKGQQYLPEFERGEAAAPQSPNYLCSSCKFYHEQRQGQAASSCAVPRKEAA